MLVRDAVEADADAIARVDVETWQVSYRGVVPDSALDALSLPPRAEKWRRILAARGESHQCVLVAEAGGYVVGFANAGPRGSVGNEEEAGHPTYDGEILCLYVAPNSQRQGVGSALMSAVAEWLQTAGLSSASLWCLGDGPAVPFYAVMGGTIVAEKLQAVAGRSLRVVCFAWADLTSLLAPTP